MSKSLRYDFCGVEIFDFYMIVVINKGVHITPFHNNILIDLANKYYKNKCFVYLTHRMNSYSVDPTIYAKTSRINNLVGFGVIAEVPVSKANAEIEKQFMTKPFEIFDSVKDAIRWSKKIINDYECEGSN
jgi:hypothetical protein